MWRSWGLGLLACLIATALVGWNASRFIGAEQKPRMKALDFLPSPTAARLLAVGHTNTSAKLRWIDSFAYFQYQLERRDDAIGTGKQSGFARLYDMLIGLDPKFLPYYQHASLNLGGVLNHDLEVQRVLNQGLLEQPHETQMWRMLAAELTVRGSIERRNPVGMNAFLDEWAAAEPAGEARQLVWDWKRAMTIRTSLGLAEIAYWEEQLALAPADSPARTFIVDTIRELGARGGVEALEIMRKRWEATRFHPPVLIADLADPALVRECFPKGLPPLAPIRIADGKPIVAPDPFGYPYTLAKGVVESIGLEAFKARRFAAGYTINLEAGAKQTGRWPATIAELEATGFTLRQPATGITWAIRDHAIVAEVSPPPFPQWEPAAK